jgi:cyanophycin synthetase
LLKIGFNRRGRKVQAMEILDIQVLRGPNYWSVNHKVISVKLNIGKFEKLPTNKISGFSGRLLKLLPGLSDHHCSRGRPGGFAQRLREGTWMGHVVEHIALELQTLADMPCYFGQTRDEGSVGIYNVVFEYREEDAGITAFKSALSIAMALSEKKSYHIGPDLELIRGIALKESPGPSTSSIIEAAIKKGIPYTRLDNGSLIQLGYGNEQKRIEATVSEHTSLIAADIAADKFRAKQILKTASVPVPEGCLVFDISELPAAVEHVGFPLVIKPVDGNQGRSVFTEVTNLDEAMAAFAKARLYSGRVLVEKFITGRDYRLLVINYKFVAAALRTPAMVTGDGKSTIRELIDIVNSDPARGDDHENVLTRIKPDDSTTEFLASRGMSLGSVPLRGQKVILRRTANLSTGGTSEDVTGEVHPEVARMAERTARAIGLDICGIDFIADNISKPLNMTRDAVIEVNAAPGFRMHTHPYAGKPQPVGDAVVEMLFPGDKNGRIPVVAITGTNGKTTTARILAHMAATAGHTVGLTTTDGIYVGNTLVEEGDCSGPVSSGKVLGDRSVSFAVLECARGGILREGLAFDRCDTGVVTNVAEDHIGLRGINSLEDMAKVKSVIPESVKAGGFAILNAGDDFTYLMKDKVKCNVALFCYDHLNERITAHMKHGGISAIHRNGKVILMNGYYEILNIDVKFIPAAFGGFAPFMTENILAAMLAAWTTGIDTEHIARSLNTFRPDFENSPGRMNLFRFSNFSFLLDYAHNLHSINAFGFYIKSLGASERVGIISAAGDRRDVDIYNVGKASAQLFDRIIIRIDEDTRGRKDNEIIELIHSGIVSSNKDLPVEIIREESEAIRHAMMTANQGSLIVLFSEKVRKAYEIISGFMQKEMAPGHLILQK